MVSTQNSFLFTFCVSFHTVVVIHLQQALVFLVYGRNMIEGMKPISH